MKLRTKKKLVKRGGYKNCRHGRIFKRAESFIKVIEYLVESGYNYIVLDSKFPDSHTHTIDMKWGNDVYRKIFKKDNRIHIIIYEDFANIYGRTCTRNGYVFYKTIRDIFKDNDKFAVFGDINYEKKFENKKKGDGNEFKN